MEEQSVSQPVGINIGKLKEPLGNEKVALRQGGKAGKVPYLPGWVAIEQANDIFGFDGWSDRLVGDVEILPMTRTDRQTGEVVECCMYRAVVEVTVGRSSRTDVGTGFALAPTYDEHDKAYKAAVTDARKRALRTWGDQFGNRLADKSERTSAASPRSTGSQRPPAARQRAQGNPQRVMRPSAPKSTRSKPNSALSESELETARRNFANFTLSQFNSVRTMHLKDENLDRKLVYALVKAAKDKGFVVDSKTNLFKAATP